MPAIVISMYDYYERSDFQCGVLDVKKIEIIVVLAVYSVAMSLRSRKLLCLLPTNNDKEKIS